MTKTHPEEAQPDIKSEKEAAQKKMGGGPIANRKCQDCLFLLLFCVFLIGMGAVGFVSFGVGSPERLINPTDSIGNICGFDNSGLSFPNVAGGTNPGTNLVGKEFLFYPTPTNTAYYICVESCPTEGDYTNPTSCLLDTANQVCDYGSSPGDGVSTSGPCYCKYPTTSVLKRCAPDVGSGSITDKIGDVQAARATAQLLMGDIAATWQWILLSLGVAVVLAWTWLFLMRKFVGFMAWTSIFVLFACECFLAYYLWDSAVERKALADAQIPVNESAVANAVTMLYMSYVMIGLCVISVFVILFMRKRVKVAIGVIREAGRAITDMPMITLFPAVTFTLLLAFYAYWSVVAAFLASAGSPVVAPDGEVSYEADTTLQYMYLYHVFGLFWVSQFILALSSVTIAGAVASWYWTRDKKQLPKGMVLKSLGRAVRYHLGSIAFGSLVIATCKFIRFMLKNLENQLKGKQNAVAVSIMKTIRCCFTFLEKALKFLNRNAYIEVAVYGGSFCTSAKRAFELITRNILRIAAVSVIGDFLLFVGQLMVAFGGGLTCFILLRREPDLNFYSIIAVMVGVMSYFIAAAFMGIYEMAIDTILLCFCEDCELNDGSEGREYFMSKELKSTIDQTAKMKSSKAA